MTSDQLKLLKQAALDAQQHAHAPYSNFLVGAALLTTTGEVFQGANVENFSFGLTMCAERVVVATAISAGKRAFQAIAVASPGGCTPCGACLQVVAEFCPELEIVIIDSVNPDNCRTTTLSDLLPQRFSFPSAESE